MGRSAGEKNVDGFYNVSLGTFAGPSLPTLVNSGAIGNRATVSASNALVLGGINGLNGATASTQVGIGTTAPAYLLHVNGSAAKPGGGSWTVASDERLKQDVTNFTDGLALIEKIKPVWFRYNGKASLPTDKKYVGVIAQQMQKIAPYMVGEFVYTDTLGKQEKYLDYDANALTYMLVNAVKELKQENQELKTQLSEVETLKREMAQLKALLLQPGNASNEAAQLWQNDPNPTDGTTVIRYYLPQYAASAQLKVYSLKGQEVYSVELTQKGNGQVQLSGREFASGMYVYHLMMDGQSVASKKLVLEK
jgi:trimeric autotransporter adhesin